ncbi:hypothetical protein OHC33_004617 [Knufia fluminis]|uniref:H/ACA ribonucleoprotein complex non-core subunit NAF1 n=1 Tax=Knufia fluminis TaxID=191047 RepID=A0AAN8EUL4_9EURO|nr:hypothetical protein OHC33_004617 [Knufia fluminis]
MEAQDFEMPSPKRQRTDSPIGARPTPPEAASSINQDPIAPLAQDNTTSASASSASIPTMSGVTDEVAKAENTDMLDVLMQHVESEAGSKAAEVQTVANGLSSIAGPMALTGDLQKPSADIEMGGNDVMVDTEAATQQEPAPITEAAQEVQPQPASTTPPDATLPPGLEATSEPAMDHLQKVADANNLPPTADTLAQPEIAPATDGAPDAQAAPEAREWESDSSPYDSSDSDTSSDSSSDDDSDEEDGEEYTLLDPYEQARILMAEDGGGGGADSDDEGGSRPKHTNAGAGLRTTNEKPEDILPKPDVTVTPEMKIEELGAVEAIVETTVLVKAATSGSYQVLESGSVLCLEDRCVIGAVHETLGRVEQPLYTVRFASDTDVRESGVSEKGTKIFYVKDHSSFVFTQPLKAVKGSDASNFHDEEVGDEEMEFSDDEAEAEHKRQLKLRRKGIDPSTAPPSGRGGRGRGQRGGRGAGGGRGGGGTYMSSIPESDTASAYNNGSLEMNYDDVEEGETEYTPLKRPQTLPHGNGMNGAQVSPQAQTSSYPPQSTRGNDNRGRGRGRGSRGNNNNDRGRGRGTGRGGNREQNNRAAYKNNNNSNFPSNAYNQSSPSSMYTNQLQPQQQQFFPQQQQQQPTFPLFPFQPPPPPQLTPYNNNSNANNTVPPSPMTPLAGNGFTFQAPNQYQNQNQNAWSQYHQNQNQQYQAHQAQYGAQNVNADAIAQVQRQLEELRRQTQGGGGGGWQGGGQ